MSEQSLMKLIDAHHHLWEPQTLPYTWLRQIGKPKPFGDPTAIQRDYLPEDYLQDFTEAKDFELVGTVHVQADSALSEPVSETNWLDQLNSSIPSGIVGFADLSKDNLREILGQHCNSRKFRGVRQIIGRLDNRTDLSFTSEDLLKKVSWRKGFSLLKEFDLSFDLQLYPEQMREAAEFLGEHPQTPVVIDHAGSPYDQTEAGLKEWATGIKMLSQLDNTHVKISGFGMYNRDWNYQNTERIFQKLYETFGAKRMMWGSNFPVDRLMQSYGHCTSQLQQWLRDLEIEEQEDICWRTAARFYRLEIGTANG